MNKGINGCLYNCSDGCSGECISKERVPINYNGEVVGYTVDGGKTMVFNDSDTSKKMVDELLNQIIGISARAIGKIKDDNTVEETEKISYDILNFGNYE
jgi:hypothetical protein